MNIFDVRDRLISDYRAFTSAFVEPRDENIRSLSKGVSLQAHSGLEVSGLTSATTFRWALLACNVNGCPGNATVSFCSPYGLGTPPAAPQCRAAPNPT